MTDDEIIAALEAEESQAIDGLSGDLGRDRARALDRYRGLDLEHTVEEGRSQIVSRDVTDTIESIMPSLTRVFLGGEDIGQFQPRGPEDEEAAKSETEVCNWYIQEKSDFFSHINSTLRDALLLKNGYLVGFWKTKTDVMSEIYTGQSDDELAMLMQDQEVSVVEHTAYPDPLYAGMPEIPGQPYPQLHDVKVERKAAEEYVAIESIPPDELLISRRHRVTSLFECDFVEWKRRVSIGQLRAEGFDVPDDTPGEDDNFGQQTIARERYQETTPGMDDGSVMDPSRRMVTFRDAYMRIDMRGKGEPQLWRFARVSGSTKFAFKDEVEVIPFAAFSPMIYPHSHVGTSVFDMVDDVGEIKTQLYRNLLDGQYLNLSGQMGVDITRVEMEDMLTSRPGGVKRVQGNPTEAFFPIPFTDQSASTLESLNYTDRVKIARTGVSGANDAIEANTLNKTATGVQAQQSSNNMRIELIARTLASGFRDLFLIVHALALKHSTKALQIKLKGKWTPVNPREWKRRTDFIISVGLGTGTPEAQMSKLMAMTPIMQQGQALGLVGPDELHNFACELWKAAGYRVYNRFLKEPQKDPKTGQSVLPPPQPPEAVLVEQERQKGDAQKTQALSAEKIHLAQMQHELERAKLDHAAQLQQMDKQNQLALQQSNDQRQSALDQQKAALEAEFKQREMDSKERIADRNNLTTLEVARIGAGVDDGTALAKAQAEAAGFGPLIDEMKQLVQHVASTNGPKRIVRDPSGRAVGVEPVTQ